MGMQENVAGDEIQAENAAKRYLVLDGIRGIALINMIVYHAIWDLVYLFGFDWQWYRSSAAYFWQQAICWTFIFLSGFCFSLGKKKLKRGMIIFLAGCVVSIVTVIFMPSGRIVFGVLTLTGSCMLAALPLEGFLKKCRPAAGFVISMLLFFVTRNINRGYLGFEAWNICRLPEWLYSNLVTTYLGFKMDGFFSTDYFSIIPWAFLFFGGYFFFRMAEQRNLLRYLEKEQRNFMEWMGQHSLVIYMLHQPVVYLIFFVIDIIVKR